jgi:hypothetical protein
MEVGDKDMPYLVSDKTIITFLPRKSRPSYQNWSLNIFLIAILMETCSTRCSRAYQ